MDKKIIGVLVVIIILLGFPILGYLNWGQLFSTTVNGVITCLAGILWLLTVMVVLGGTSSSDKPRKSSLPYKRIVTDEDGNWYNDG